MHARSRIGFDGARSGTRPAALGTSPSSQPEPGWVTKGGGAKLCRLA